jgi:hypothetical protein
VVNAVQQSSLNKRNENKNVATLSIRNSPNRLSLRLGFFLIPLVLAWLALSPRARPQDGAVGDGTSTAEGNGALASLTTGIEDTAIGFDALAHNTTGFNNVAMGSNAGANLTTGSNNIDIGNVGVAGEAAKIRIGKVGTQTAAFIAGIHAVPVTGTAVVVSTNGQLG